MVAAATAIVPAATAAIMPAAAAMPAAAGTIPHAPAEAENEGKKRNQCRRRFFHAVDMVPVCGGGMSKTC
jgi:hypothetical protein